MISLIAAMDRNRLIGTNNELPWRLPADLAYFKRVTMGHPVIMGRKTYESIGRPLPGRENIIVTRNPAYKAEGCVVVHSLDELLTRFASSDKEAFVIGGAELYKEALSVGNRLYITHIEDEFSGDAWFPCIDDWQEISREPGIRDEKNPHAYYFSIYEKKNQIIGS
ncbi:dihydrofolate reductase [Ectobacillus antri]|jgi:dihydrofolate reductase|uniref:Dihydrofolate reductase n=1 Tax=Ectobacillus antri TaxID=2486280 RepID=A0ABT6H243_9BACI|nr:dihydrofolate reductase [Ectobacillus antri]MDG4656347.1 dihydrofolate reductase [Ectobacillus antri]MDG5753022.1 dihydrofolate reductase [Ectobacillus antri]